MSDSKKTNLGLLLVLQVLFVAPSAAQDTAPAAQALLEQFDEMYRSTGGTAARIEIKIERPEKGADDADALLEPRRGQSASRH